MNADGCAQPSRAGPTRMPSISSNTTIGTRTHRPQAAGEQRSQHREERDDQQRRLELVHALTVSTDRVPRGITGSGQRPGRQPAESLERPSGPSRRRAPRCGRVPRHPFAPRPAAAVSASAFSASASNRASSARRSSMRSRRWSARSRAFASFASIFASSRSASPAARSASRTRLLGGLAGTALGEVVAAGRRGIGHAGQRSRRPRPTRRPRRSPTPRAGAPGAPS